MNITLIGMPGAGKSTVGVLLAKSLLMDFADTDLIIQRQAGKSLCEIINSQGRDSFIKLENDIIASLHFENTVIATGGIVMQSGQTLDDIYELRAQLYEKYADVTIDCANLSIEECVASVINAVNSEK